MTNSSVPSTLVKCLYLFFDLPEISVPPSDTKLKHGEIPPHERRSMLQKIFAQVYLYDTIIINYPAIILFLLLYLTFPSITYTKYFSNITSDLNTKS